MSFDDEPVEVRLVPVDQVRHQCSTNFERVRVSNTYQEYKDDILRTLRIINFNEHYNKQWLLDRVPTYAQWLSGISGDMLPIYYDAMIYRHLYNTESPLDMTISQVFNFMIRSKALADEFKL